jgi:ubiquinone/menaquinone biosynthesis C-methylase UbiE
MKARTSLMPSARVNYDAIADLYDTQPYREKSVDPELLALVGQSAVSNTLSVLDIGCGTGNQLVADRGVVPDAHLVGLDRSLGMLRHARSKAPDTAWVQADGAMLPFRPQSFHLVTCQHALHHVQNKADMLGSAFRVLCPGGRLVLYSLCPQESADWLYYEYFPAAHAIDLVDFWAPEAVAKMMQDTGFIAVTAERQHIHYQQNLRLWLDIVRRRDTCSQLMAIPDEAYTAGLRRLEQELSDGSAPDARPDHICFVTIRGQKPMDPTK